MLWTWLGLYVFVGIQMAWVVRPFVGAQANRCSSFAPRAWCNAYEVVLRLVWQAIFGGRDRAGESGASVKRNGIPSYFGHA